MILSVLLVLPAVTQAKGITSAALDHLPPADVVILGEVHDNRFHHDNQARAVAAIKPAALVFEMLRPDQVARVGSDDWADPATLEAALDWQDTGFPDFEMYWPIFAAAPGVPVYGAALPRETVRAAVFDGAAQPFGPDAAVFGLDQPLAASEQALREAGQMEAHCNAMPADMMPGMVAAQRLRDAAFARTVIAAHAAHGGPVVLITGNGHARTDWGVPLFLRKVAPDLTVLALAQLEEDPEPDAPFDQWLVTAPIDRPDPCAVFR